jgi:succinate dehydrogenase / fumarate reductase cytochrome b subunit
MIILGFHLNHGVASAFQTLGLKTQKYLSPIEKFAGAFSILVPVAFASIPIILYLQSL